MTTLSDRELREIELSPIDALADALKHDVQKSVAFQRTLLALAESPLPPRTQALLDKVVAALHESNDANRRSHAIAMEVSNVLLMRVARYQARCLELAGAEHVIAQSPSLREAAAVLEGERAAREDPD